MNRTLRRPMFRIGGTAEGITSGLQPRQGYQGTDISRAGQVGAMDQAYAQANIDAQREKARMGLYEPMERIGFLGSGLTGLMGGMGPQYQFATQPNPSPLATALGIGSTGAGIYKALGQGTRAFSGLPD